MADDTYSNVELAAELTMAWLSNANTRVAADEVPTFLTRMHEAVSQLASGGPAVLAPEPQQHTPAVSPRKSLASREHIISLVDGKPYKTLRRHLASHGMTPEQYRDRYGLKSDYPMVAESYSENRREMAKKIGLGRKKDASAPTPVAAPKRKPKTSSEPKAALEPKTESEE